MVELVSARTRRTLRGIFPTLPPVPACSKVGESVRRVEIMAQSSESKKVINMFREASGILIEQKLGQT